MEPTRLEAIPPSLADDVVELRAQAERLGARLAPATAANLADVVRVMNSYYSNLIEGHNTRLADLDAAFALADVGRDRVIEARAHIRLQQTIDHAFAAGALPEPATRDYVRHLHREFYADATPAMLRVGEGAKAHQMAPGVFRIDGEDAVIGLHQAPSGGEVVERCMRYFENKFAITTMGASEKIIAVAIAHHRFNFVHPFADGNGRVSRLMSHAMGHLAGIGASGLWSISRGLARGLNPGPGGRGDYHAMMDLADHSREGDLDGRGNLSLRCLQTFVSWFVRVALDQIAFMHGLFEFDALSRRLSAYAMTIADMPVEATYILRDLCLRGEIPRGELHRSTGLQERTTRTIIAKLAAAGLIGSASPKTAVSLRFPVLAIPMLFPNLYSGPVS